MAYQIITDSCCDYPDTMYAEIDVKEVALSVTFRGETTNHYDEAYLKDAQETAQGAYQRFTEVRKAVDGTETRFYTASPWFNVILLRGLTALYEVDHNPEYIRTMADNARYAWDHTRDVNGFLDNDWTGIKTKEHKWLLDNACMVELFSEINNIK